MRAIQESNFRIRIVALLMAACGLTSTLHAQRPQPPSRVIAAVDERDRVALRGAIHPFVRRAIDNGEAAGDLQLSRMQLMLAPSAEQKAALQDLLAAQQDKRSLLYHQWLTPDQFGEKFGVAQHDIDIVTGWLLSHGFSVEPVSPARNLIVFTGSHAQLQDAFRATIHSYILNGESHYANASVASIPSALAPVVSSFVALNNFSSKPARKPAGTFKRDRVSSRWVKSSPVQPNPLATTVSPTYDAVGPYDFATIYNVLPLWNAGYDGTGQSIAIIGRSDIHMADVDSFRSQFGLPATHLNIIYDGPNPGFTSSEDESDLDVEWSGAVARGATIDYVTAGSTAVSDGIALASQYAVSNNIAPVLSISYGECEAALGSGNEFYSALWQQAAAQGISVIASSGDSASAGCDNENAVGESVYGHAVSGIASTPYNVAAGGTDFTGNYPVSSTYWNATDNPTTLQSAKSYIPETPWNDSCASPLVLQVLGPGTGATTAEELCNSTPAYSDGLINIVGGSGGPSGYSGTTQLNQFGWEDLPVFKGYAKPAWQSGVPGIPADGVRDLPDISLFAGSGLWGSFYLYCDTDSTSTGSCDFINGGEVLGAGGTSFVAPSFAGIMAIVNQYQAKQGQSAEQGNPNYVLYNLAANEYNNTSILVACGSSTVANGNSCIFYDINQGGNAVPCAFPSPLSPGCTLANGNDQFGVLAGWAAGSGYDLASGLGSVNAYNLVTRWNSASSTFKASKVSLSPNSTFSTYGAPLQVSTSVVPAPGETETPTGSVSIILGDGATAFTGFSGGPFTLNGSGQIDGTITGLPAGTQTIVASYSGDAIFSGGVSAATQVVVAQAATTSTLTVSRSTLNGGDSVTFNFTVNTSSTANSPTGNVVFTDSTSGTTLGTAALQPFVNGSGYSIATTNFNVPASSLMAGNNSVTASYSGDSNYKGSIASAVQLTKVGGFTLSANPSSLSLVADGTGTATVTIAPSAGTLTSAVSLSCAPATLPAGIICSFSPTSIPTGSSAATSVLTLQTLSPLLVKGKTEDLVPKRQTWQQNQGLVGLAVLLLFVVPRRRPRHLCLLGLVLSVALLQIVGCSGPNAGTGTAPGSTTGSGAPPVASSTSLTASTASALLNSPVAFTTTVAPTSGIGTPTGTVVFLDGNSKLASASLVNGVAAFSSTTLGLGPHSITAQYSGDANFSVSTSSVVTENILFNATLNVIGTDSAGNTSAAPLAVTVQ